MARRLSQLAQLPVTELKGVGDARSGALGKLGVRTVLDLLTYYPRRYLDRTNQARLGDLEVGDEATVLVKVVRTTSRRTRNGKSLVTTDVTDGTAHLQISFFNQPLACHRSNKRRVMYSEVNRLMISPTVKLTPKPFN